MERYTLEEILYVIDAIGADAARPLLTSFHSTHEAYSKAFGALEGVRKVRRDFADKAKEIFKIED